MPGGGLVSRSPSRVCTTMKSWLYAVVSVGTSTSPFSVSRPTGRSSTGTRIVAPACTGAPTVACTTRISAPACQVFFASSVRKSCTRCWAWTTRGSVAPEFAHAAASRYSRTRSDALLWASSGRAGLASGVSGCSPSRGASVTMTGRPDPLMPQPASVIATAAVSTAPRTRPGQALVIGHPGADHVGLHHLGLGGHVWFGYGRFGYGRGRRRVGGFQRQR